MSAIYGSAARDTLVGTSGADALVGLEGDDLLDGGAGNDTLDGHGGAGSGQADTLIGGDGSDLMTVGITTWGSSNTGNDSVDAGVGNDTVRIAGWVTDTLLGGEGQDHLWALATANLVGSSINGFETLSVNSGTWSNPNGAPEVTLTAAQFAAFGVIRSGHTYSYGYVLTGADAGLYDLSVRTVTSLDVLNGSSGADTLRGDANGNALEGQNGHDVIEGLGGDDRLGGGSGNDSIFGGNGRDTLTGGSGDDWLDGGEGDDYLYGDFGNDTVLLSSQAVEFLDGGDGIDVVWVTTGSTISPTVNFSGFEKIIVNNGGGISLTPSQFASFSTIDGGSLAITGSTPGLYNLNQTSISSSSTLLGSMGDDTIRGGSQGNVLAGC